MAHLSQRYGNVVLFSITLLMITSYHDYNVPYDIVTLTPALVVDDDTLITAIWQRRVVLYHFGSNPMWAGVTFPFANTGSSIDCLVPVEYIPSFPSSLYISYSEFPSSIVSISLTSSTVWTVYIANEPSQHSSYCWSVWSCSSRMAV